MSEKVVWACLFTLILIVVGLFFPVILELLYNWLR